MRQGQRYHQLFELLRQHGLARLSVSRTTLGLSDSVSDALAKAFLQRAQQSWRRP